MNGNAFGMSLLASALIAVGGAMPALAQVETPGIDRAQAEIRVRIQEGIDAGLITQDEAETLFRADREIERREARMKADGYMTSREREILRRDIAALRDEVERSINNNEVAGWPDSPAAGLDRRHALIHARIEQGIASGHITRGEAARLMEREREIHALEAAFLADGFLSDWERWQLREQFGELRAEVESMMANDRRVFGGDVRRDYGYR